MKRLIVTGRQMGIAAAVLMGSLGVFAAKCPLPGDWKLDLDVSDEFNAEGLDKAKWWDYWGPTARASRH